MLMNIYGMKKQILSAIFLLMILTLPASTTFAEEDNCIKSAIEKYQASDYTNLLGKLQGISDNQLKQHFELYHGYINSINSINAQLKSADHSDKTRYRALELTKSYANNGVLLHELYFSNLTGDDTEPSSELQSAINKGFGSMQNYLEDIKTNAKVSRGWVITGYNERDGKLHNYVVDFHDLHVPFGVVPLMSMDVWEHAYMVDYGIDRDKYIDAFMNNLDWEAVSKRYMSIFKKASKQDK
jgi:Fe-Mn family superoxide dismutase